MSAKTRGVITSAVVLTVIIGSLNSVYKKGSLPGFRFYFGNGMMWLFLTFFGQFEEELAKNLAVAVAVFVTLGEGGGMIDHFLGKGQANSTLNTQPLPSKNVASRGSYSPGQPMGVDTSRRNTGVNTTSAFPGLFPIKPVIPNAHS